MAEFNRYDLLDNQDRRPIRYTQYITSMLATTEGKTFLDISDFGMSEYNIDSDLFARGVEETFEPFGWSTRDQEGGISLQKRWRQARSLLVDEINDNGQTLADIGVVTHQSNATSYTGDLGNIDAGMHETHGDINDPTSGGPYKMSDFFGFSHVIINWNGTTGYWAEYSIGNIDGHTGFSKGMQIIRNTDANHPNLASWFGNSTQSFPTGSGGKKIIYAGGEGTDYDNPLAPWINSGLTGVTDGFVQNVQSAQNPSKVLQLHLGPGRDYFYSYLDLSTQDQMMLQLTDEDQVEGDDKVPTEDDDPNQETEEVGTGPE